MHRSPHVHALCLSLAALLAACSSDDASDASVSDVPAVSDASVRADAQPTGDVGPCADFTGGYTLTGTCTVPGFSPFPTACITQSGCAAQVQLETGTAPGAVVGNRLTFMSSVSGVPLACTATRNDDGTLAVRCEAGAAASCDAVATAPTFPGATRWCCSVAAQDCGAGQRCNIVGVGSANGTPITACIPAGADAEGASCTRADGRLGADTCGAGLSCVNYGQSMASQRACVRTCATGGGCQVGEFCFIASTTPRAGVCRYVCVPGATDPCMGHGTCRYLDAAPPGDDTGPAVRVPTCQPTGAATEGMPCASNLDCAANLACARRTGADPFACRRICDRNNPCPTGACSGVESATDPLASGTCLP